MWTISCPVIISIYILSTFIGLIELLDEAKSFIPKEYWKTTPITLKATAGLRLLPKEEGDAILDVARTVSNLYYRIIKRLKRIGNILKSPASWKHTLWNYRYSKNQDFFQKRQSLESRESHLSYGKWWIILIRMLIRPIAKESTSIQNDHLDLKVERLMASPDNSVS